MDIEKKTYLIDYLKQTNQRLFVCLCGEKYGLLSGQGIGHKSFSGSYQITGEGNVVYEDRLHIVNQPIQKRVEAGIDPMEFMSQVIGAESGTDLQTPNIEKKK